MKKKTPKPKTDEPAPTPKVGTPIPSPKSETPISQNWVVRNIYAVLVTGGVLSVLIGVFGNQYFHDRNAREAEKIKNRASFANREPELLNQVKRFERIGEAFRTMVFTVRTVHKARNEQTIGIDTTEFHYTLPLIAVDSIEHEKWQKLYSAIESNRDKLPIEMGEAVEAIHIYYAQRPPVKDWQNQSDYTKANWSSAVRGRWLTLHNRLYHEITKLESLE